MDQKGYYETLGVAKDASPRQIKDAFRKLAFRYHPDRNIDDSAAADRMKAVNEAYAVLSDPAKRKRYDVLHSQFGSSAYDHFRQTHSQEDIFRGSDVHQVFEEIAKAAGFRGFDEIFKEFYGPGYRSFEFGRPGFRGRGFVFTGRFGQPGSAGKPLAGRDNLGRLGRYVLKKVTGLQVPQAGTDIHDVIQLHPDQARDGGPYAYYVRKRSKKLVVKIPPGIRDGQQIRLAAMGEAGKEGGAAGDLFLKVKIKVPLLERARTFITGSKKKKR